MDKLKEELAYLKGLTEAEKLKRGERLETVVKRLIDAFISLAQSVEALQKSQEDLKSSLEALKGQGEFAKPPEQEAICPNCGRQLILPNELEITCPGCNTELVVK